MSLVFCMYIQHTYACICILIQWKCHLIASNSTAVVVFGPPADQSNLCACALTLLIYPLTAAYYTHKPRNLNAIYRSRSAYCALTLALLSLAVAAPTRCAALPQPVFADLTSCTRLTLVSLRFSSARLGSVLPTLPPRRRLTRLVDRWLRVSFGSFAVFHSATASIKI